MRAAAISAGTGLSVAFARRSASGPVWESLAYADCTESQMMAMFGGTNVEQAHALRTAGASQQSER